MSVCTYSSLNTLLNLQHIWEAEWAPLGTLYSTLLWGLLHWDSPHEDKAQPKGSVNEMYSWKYYTERTMP